ncbi:MAG: hypothetical protein ABIY70_07660 [Capsulimonas sp.]|uniref:hypothetical protein n=1 Tax=Capsulimonas sp. TaxID=2494211 RepID=UPI003263C2F3
MDNTNHGTPPPPCRLHGFLAAEAPVAVLLRRGPAKNVQMIKWNTGSDTFELGQWLKGRVYEDRCDLSPDGALFFYTAGKYDGKHQDDRKIGSYYGVLSRPPYFTALTVWSAWSNGPAYFLSSKLLMIGRSQVSDVQKRQIPKRGRFPAGLHVETFAHENSASIHQRHLELTGWKSVLENEVYEKPLPTSDATLVKTKRMQGYSYTLRTPSDLLILTGVDWADVDQRGRLVFTRDGKVFACNSMENGLDGAIELADFNSSTFEPLAAPEWAKAW